jgi:hypothetical protein
MKYYSGVLVGLVISAAVTAVLLSRSKASTDPGGSVTFAEEYHYQDGKVLGKLYYIRDDSNRKCFAIYRESGPLSNRNTSMVAVDCQDILWR